MILFTRFFSGLVLVSAIANVYCTKVLPRPIIATPHAVRDMASSATDKSHAPVIDKHHGRRRTYSDPVRMKQPTISNTVLLEQKKTIALAKSELDLINNEIRAALDESTISEQLLSFKIGVIGITEITEFLNGHLSIKELQHYYAASIEESLLGLVKLSRCIYDRFESQIADSYTLKKEELQHIALLVNTAMQKVEPHFADDQKLHVLHDALRETILALYEFTHINYLA